MLQLFFSVSTHTETFHENKSFFQKHIVVKLLNRFIKKWTTIPINNINHSKKKQRKTNILEDDCCLAQEWSVIFEYLNTRMRNNE